MKGRRIVPNTISNVIPFVQINSSSKILKDKLNMASYEDECYNSDTTHQNTKKNGSKEEFVMDDNTLLERYMAKIDQDQAALREDIRSSENRIHKHSSEIETRMEKRMETIDQRFERMETLYNNTNSNIEEKFDKITGSINNNKLFMWGMFGTFVALTVATLIAIASLVIPVVQFNNENSSPQNQPTQAYYSFETKHLTS